MIRTSRRAAAALAATTAAALLAASPMVASAAPSAARPSVQPRATTAARAVPGGVAKAQQALARAQALLAARPPVAARGTGATAVAAAPVRDATMILRDLAARLRQLHGADRATALAILARPSQNPDPDGIVTWSGRPDQSVCSATVSLCVHWTPTGQHAPDLTDTSPANGTPDYVDQTLAETENVWATEVGALGYKAPLADGASPEYGPGDQLDVYLANIGGKGLYGYCTSDDPDLQRAITPATSAVSAYCVFDNDYAEAGFGAHTPLENLQVTAAHEFMHAVQFGYDFYEDRWLMESSAAWVEDVVYDAVNDNRQYLSDSPLARPRVPVDKGIQFFQYGSWIFLRYLSERFGDDVVRRIWARADDSPDQQTTNDFQTYSVRAINTVLNRQGTSLRKVLGDFAAASVTPAASYAEGASYPKPSLATYRVSPSRPSTPVVSAALRHLSSLPTSVKPGAGVRLDARLRVRIDAPAAGTGPEARVLVRFRDGRTVHRTVGLDRTGSGMVTVPFGRGRVASVVVVLANGGNRYADCFTGNPWGGLSCWGGTPVDDGLRYSFQARLV